MSVPQVEEWCNSLGALVLEKLQELSGNFKYIVARPKELVLVEESFFEESA